MQLLGRFREDFFFVPFVTCSMVKAAIHRGFSSWSDNSARIKFHDVTGECAKLSPTGEASVDCPLAELWITYMPTQPAASTASEQEALTASELRVEVQEGDGHALGGSTAAALAIPLAAAVIAAISAVSANSGMCSGSESDTVFVRSSLLASCAPPSDAEHSS